MKMLAWYYGLDVPASRTSNATTIDRKLTFDKVTNVHYRAPRTTKTSRLTCWCTPKSAHRSADLTWSPLHPLLPGERLRDHPRARPAGAPADQRV